MDGLKPGRGGRGKPVSRDRWPVAGAQRDWLAFCDKIHRVNGLRSLRALGKEMPQSATRVGELQLIMAKTRHKSPRAVMRYVKPGDEAIAEVTSLLGSPRRTY